VANYAKAHLATSTERTALYAHIDWVTNTIGIVLQLTLTRWLLVRRGAVWGLVVPALVNLVLMVVVLVYGNGTFMVWGMAIPSLAVTMAVTRGFAYGMTKPSSDALYTRVPRETRYKGKNVVETLVWRFGDVVVTSGVNLFAAIGIGVGGMAAVGAGISGLAAWVARRAGHSPDLLPDDGDRQPATAAARSG